MKQSYNLWYEIKYIKYNNNIGECYFKNGSYIKIVTMADTARSARANIIFIDVGSFQFRFTRLREEEIAPFGQTNRQRLQPTHFCPFSTGRRFSSNRSA